jgi:hypothetical protein
MLSATREVDQGARVAVLLAEGLFRFDVCPQADTLRTVVRNLSEAGLTFTKSGGMLEAGPTNAAAAIHYPGGVDLGFALGEGPDRVEVDLSLATLHFMEQGTTRVTAQALVRPA